MPGTRILVATALCLIGAVIESSEVSAADTGAFTGHWESKIPYCEVTIEQKGNKLLGDYSSCPLENSARVQTGGVAGTVTSPGHAKVQYSSSLAEKDDRGTAELDLVKKGLRWQLVKRAGKDEDYALNKVVMKKTKPHKQEN